MAAAKKKNANLTKAMKLAQSGASAFKIVRYTRKLAPEDEVAVFEALAKKSSVGAADHLAKAYARAGRFAEAVRVGKKGKYPGTLQEIGERALDAGAFDAAESAFAAVKKPSAAVLVGVAIARKKAGKDPSDALARAEKANVAKAIDWKSATSCYAHVNVAIATAMIASVSGDAAKAKRTIAQARAAFAQVAQKSVREECDDQLASPSDEQWWGSAIARHAGL